MATIEAKRVEYMGHSAVILSNDQVVTAVEAVGGMVPLFGARRGASVLNAHWVPDFRDTSGTPWNETAHAPYWKVPLLRILAGDFTCTPSFGGNCEVDGVAQPVHGWGANARWTLEAAGVDAASGGAYARWTLPSPDPALPLDHDKLDLVLPGQPAYFSFVRLRNRGATSQAVNLIRHNTVGAPFLAAGCQLSVSADRFMAAPQGTEFDPTGRLALGATFEDLAAAPLRAGGTANLREIPGMIGYTDFVMGAVPERAPLGWSCVVNPWLSLAYVCFFPGAPGLPAGEVAGTFNELWMQYGGRSFSPWALVDGSGDRVFCLGTENGVSSFNLGLPYARQHPALLGRPTVFEVPAGGTRTFAYGTALVALGEALVREGVRAVRAEPGAMVLEGTKAYQRAPVGADFGAARAAAARLLA